MTADMTADTPASPPERPDRAYPRHPLVGVGAIVLRDDRVLLIRRGQPPRKGEWSLPGGLQHVGETVFEAAVREVAEETGLVVRVAELVEVVDSITRDAEGRVLYHYTLIDVRADWLAGEPVAADDAADAAWVALDALAAFRLWPETARVIAKAAAQRQAASADAARIGEGGRDPRPPL